MDGEAWTSDPASAYWSVYHEDLLSFQGAAADFSRAISGNISGYTGPGVYALSGGQTYAQLVGGVTSSEPGAWASTTGTVEITCDDGEVIGGTIEFEGTDPSLGTTKIITNGVFTLPPL